MAKLIGGSFQADATPTSIYDHLVAAGVIDEDRRDPMFIMNLTVQNNSGAVLYLGDSTLDSGTPRVMLILQDGQSLAEILNGYHVNLRDVFVEGDGTVSVLGLQ